MEPKKNYIGLIAGIILTAAGIGMTAYGMITRQSAGYETNQVIENVFIFGMIAAIAGAVVLISGILNLNRKSAAKAVDVRVMAQAALLAALCYIGFQFFRFDIPVGTEKTAIHFGNAFCVLAALLLGGTWGGMAGAVGMTLADLTSGYATSAPKTFLLKLLIGLIVGLVAHRIAHLKKEHAKGYIVRWTIIASVCGMVFNLFADPIVGYFYKTWLLGIPQDLSATLAKIGAATTAVNALTSVVIATVLYCALRPALLKSGLLTGQTKPDSQTGRISHTGHAK